MSSIEGRRRPLNAVERAFIELPREVSSYLATSSRIQHGEGVLRPTELEELKAEQGRQLEVVRQDGDLFKAYIDFVDLREQVDTDKGN